VRIERQRSPPLLLKRGEKITHCNPIEGERSPQIGKEGRRTEKSLTINFTKRGREKKGQKSSTGSLKERQESGSYGGEKRNFYLFITEKV